MTITMRFSGDDKEHQRRPRNLEKRKRDQKRDRLVCEFRLRVTEIFSASEIVVVCVLISLLECWSPLTTVKRVLGSLLIY